MKPLSPLLFIGILLCLKSFGQTSVENSISLDGIDDFIDVGTPILSSSNSFQPFTLEFWIKTGTTEHQAAFSQYTQQSPNRCEIKINYPNNKLSFWKFNTGVALVSESDITDNNWHHIAIVKNENRELFLYVDCQLEDTGYDPYPFTDTNFTIGRIWHTSINRFFEGQLNNFRIWSKARSIEEVSNSTLIIYDSSTPDLEVCYDFNQGVASGNNPTEDIAYDASSNQYDGDLYNFSLTGNNSNWVEFSGAEACQNVVMIDSLIYSCTDTLFAFDQIFTEAGLYQVYQEGSQGIDTLFILDLQFSDPNQFNISPTDTIINSDETIDCYLADALGNPYDAATSVQWSPAEWFSCDTCVQTTFEGLDTIEYQVDFVDAYGCSNSLSGTYITLPDEELVDVIVIDSLIYSCEDTLFAFNQLYTESGTYEIFLDGPQDMDSLFILNIQFSDPNQFSISPSNSVIHLDETIDCYLADALGNPYDAATSVQWSPAEWFSCDTCVRTTFEGFDTIEYQVDFVDTYGCSNSLFGTYITLPYGELDIENAVYIPNCFSPNNDGINDYFEVYFTDAVDRVIKMEVLDRWGCQVFLAEEGEVRWNGQFRNQKVNPGVFVYIIQVRYINGEEEYFKGDFTLIR